MKLESSEKKSFVLQPKRTVQVVQSGGNVFCECGGEFVLPDYMPKVQKVLRVEARALPPTRYMGSGSAQMTGSVLHTLIYVGEEGEVSATVLPADYEFSVPLGDAENPTVTAPVEVDSMTYRLSAPRKVNIRTRLRSRPRIYTCTDMTETQMPAGEIDGLHKLCGSFDSILTKFLSAPEFTVSDTIEQSGSTESKPIWCGATAAVTDARVAEGGVSVRGDVCVKVLNAERTGAKMVEKKIPFEEFIDGEVQKGAYATAVASVLSTEAGKEDDTGNLLVDVVLRLEARVDTPCKADAVFDAFSERAEGNVAYRTVRSERLLYDRCGVYNAGGSVSAATAGAVGATAVLDTSGEATVEEVRAEGTRIVVTGKCMLRSIYLTEDGGFSSGEYAVPFRIVLDAEVPAGAEAAASAGLIHARARLDGDNVVCDMDIAVCAYAVLPAERTVVEKMDYSAAKPYAKSNHPLCLIYPNGESLWSLSKKYHVSPASLAKVNEISAEASAFADPALLSDRRVLMLEFK